MLWVIGFFLAGVFAVLMVVGGGWSPIALIAAAILFYLSYSIAKDVRGVTG